VGISPDGRYVLSGGGHLRGDQGDFKIWDLAAGDELARFVEHSGRVTDLASGANGVVATGSQDGTIRLWHLQRMVGRTQRRQATPKHEGAVNAVCSIESVEESEGIVATAGMDGNVMVWSQRGRRQHLVHLRPPNLSGYKWIRFASVVPGGRHLLCGSEDGTVWLVDCQTGAIEASNLEHHWGWEDRGLGPPSIAALATAGDGEWGVTASREAVVLWELPVLSPERLAIEGDVRALAMTRDGSRVVAGCRDGSVCVWDVAAERPHSSLPAGDSPIEAVLVTPDTDEVLILARGAISPVVCDIDGMRSTFFEPAPNPLRRMTLSGDGRFLVAGADDGSLVAWDPLTGERIGHLVGRHSPVTALAGPPPGDDRFLSGDAAGTIRLWDAVARRDLGGISVESGIKACAVMPGGTFVAGDDLGRVHFLRPSPRRRSGPGE
jgi:WD40 repeat protein